MPAHPVDISEGGYIEPFANTVTGSMNKNITEYQFMSLFNLVQFNKHFIHSTRPEAIPVAGHKKTTTEI